MRPKKTAGKKPLSGSHFSNWRDGYADSTGGSIVPEDQKKFKFLRHVDSVENWGLAEDCDGSNRCAVRSWCVCACVVRVCVCVR